MQAFHPSVCLSNVAVINLPQILLSTWLRSHSMDSSWSVRELCRHHCHHHHRHHHHRRTVDHYFFSCFWLTFHMDGMDFLCLLFSVLWWNSTSVVNYTDLQLLSAVLQCSLVLLHLSDASEWVSDSSRIAFPIVDGPARAPVLYCLPCVMSHLRTQ